MTLNIGFWILLVTAELASVKAEVNTGINRCPSGLPSTSAMETFNGLCYQFVGEERHWNRARDYCFQYGGRLVKIDDPDTNNFIVRTLNSLWWRNNGVWIGLNDRNIETKWQWLGSLPYTSEPVHWTNWGNGHPRGFLHTMRDCVRMVRGSGNWLWHETPCQLLNWQYRFICEYEMTPTSRPLTVRITTTPLVSNDRPSFAHRSGQKPNISERRTNDFPSSTADRESLSYSSEMELDQNVRVTEDITPVLAAAIKHEQLQSVNDNKWYIAFICLAAVTVLLFVGLILWMRRRNRNSKFIPHMSDGKPADTGKPMDSSEKTSNFPSNLASFNDLHRVKPNIYTQPCHSLSRGNSEFYEDVQPRRESVTSSSSSSDELASSPVAAVDGESRAYVAMNGSVANSKYVAPDEVKCRESSTAGVTEVCTLPDYENSHRSPLDDVADRDAADYDVPRPSNIYSEIPEVECDIYESLDDVKNYTV